MKKIILLIALVSMSCINAWNVNFKNNAAIKVAVKFYYNNAFCNPDERQLDIGQAISLDVGSCIITTVQLWNSNKDKFYEKKDYKPGRMTPSYTVEVTPDLKIQVKDSAGNVIPDVPAPA